MNYQHIDKSQLILKAKTSLMLLDMLELSLSEEEKVMQLLYNHIDQLSFRA
jgi:hypothetical protein